MQQSNFFLRTKLLPPRAVSELLRRPRLNERLAAHLNAPITMVAADAGYGKTTLVSDFLRNQNRPYVWYQLDHTDADPIVFLNYVALGIKDLENGFGDALISYLAEANEDLVRTPERAADLLINEILQSIVQPFILVLDDYHHIGPDTVVHKIVDRILQYSSELLHLIITTRDLPPLAITRRRSQKKALVIDREDLLFTDSEVRELFRNSLSVELGELELAEYRDRTHGWVTALQLVRQVAEKEADDGPDGSSPSLSEILRRSEKDIFDYFAEEVFSREEVETKELLLRLSLLRSLPLEQCSMVFPDLRCSAALPELVQKNVFLTVAGDGTDSEEYRLHPLFRDFLLRRLRSEIGQAGVTAERNRIAEVFLENDHWELALPFLLEAENFDRAAEVISDRGDEWIAAGAIRSLEDFIDKVPIQFLEKHARSLLHKAEIARLQGDTGTSTLLLNSAVKLFRKQKDPALEAEALHSLASLARRRSRPDEALVLLEAAEKLAERGSETYMKCLNTRGLCFIAQSSWSEAEQQFRAALELAEARANEQYVRLIAHNLALAPGFRGDFGEALKWLYKIFREDTGQKFPQEAIGHLNVARLHLYRGEFEKTEVHLRIALELSQLFNLKSLLPEVFEAYANFYRETSDLPHAAEYYERAKAAYDDAGIEIATRELNEERARFFMIQGDLRKGRILLEDLIAARKKLGLDFSVKIAELALSRIRLMEGDLGQLTKELEELLEFFHEQDRYYDEALTAMLLAETFFKLEKKKETVELIVRVLDLSARYDYDYWLRTEIRRNQKLFEYEDIFEKLPPDLRDEIKAGGDAASQPRIQAVEAITRLTDLTIKILGPVEIYRDPSKLFATDAWTTRRSRDIFCYIATRKNHRVPKDVLIEAFWGDEDLAAVEKNFHPTISHIRKALNSRQDIKQNFIVFRDGSYQLNPEYSYSIDSDDFLNFITVAESAKREKDASGLRTALESAYGLYRGEFMEGCYDDWAEEQRIHFQEQFVRVLNGLAKLSVTDSRWSDALKYASETLQIDPYREDLHRLVLKVLSAQNKLPAAKKHYENMSKQLLDELGVEPSAETRRLYQEITG